MGPIQALRSCISKSFRWKGRASRSEFWWFTAIYYGGLAALVVLYIATAQGLGDGEGGPLVAYFVVMFFPFLSAFVRRLHDKGLTAWLLLLGFVPFGQLALLILAVLRGDEGPNGYGDDPLGRPAPEGLTYGRSRVPLVRDKD
ncbi:DUF805 domain-containing protein [Litoreibacter albidus]|uniref:Uncharacterized membrane protein YhaH, DUF805 family n=1 Tax=Litoreibacter albidus TaxID=670155 RepID=A0A1H3AGT2_9RHOB|nr:DUF805 domain-containing protein [Litoreibacter albidus]SDX28805.1 Uncharacterized membrane protein YhaH, DUF805 family [Litoreibacter albidus]